jgi:hypothetical protein
MLREQDSVKSRRVMQALFKMEKIDIADLQKATAQQ